MFKLMRLKEPEYLLKLLTQYESDRPHTRGLRVDLRLTRVAFEIGRTSFEVQGAQLWNTLPVMLRDLPSLSRFKREIPPKW